MKPQKLNRIGRLLRMQQLALRRNCGVTYHRLLALLCSHYSHLEILKPLHRAILNGDWKVALDEADSLASQKYEDATLHFVANQFAALVRKYPFDPKIVNTDPRGKALKTFLKSEHKCSRLNKFFSLLNKRDPYSLYTSKMRSFIQYLIGLSPDMEEIYSECNFGGGASVGVHGNATNLGRKISSCQWSVSPGAFVHGFNSMMSHHQLRNFLFEKRVGYYCFDGTYAFQKYKERTACITYNKISFVPKTAKTERTIAVEPLVNGYLQKGVDVCLRARLRRININLNDQTRNQEMAREGSLSDSEDSFVTIDLSSASDSISTGLVRYLFPEDWFYLLDSIRSREFLLAGKKFSYHKFCSMGNGFCFPIETLIFVAVCESCGCGIPGTDYSVYGDDIIIRKRYADKVIWLLKKLGFSTNKDKTFLEGPFRESCGSDWFGGQSVRPFTLDFKLDSVESVYKFLNITKERSSTELFFKEVRPFLFGLLPVDLRLLRPFKGNHDSGIDGYVDEFLSSPSCLLSKREQHWRWYELAHSPVDDKSPIYGGADDESVWMYALLAGVPSNRSIRHPVKFVLRRKTRTTVVLTGHGGATSLWLPSS